MEFLASEQSSYEMIQSEASIRTRPIRVYQMSETLQAVKDGNWAITDY